MCSPHLIVLSLDPDAKNGPALAPFLLSTPAASFIGAAELSGAQVMHSTTWSCALNSARHSFDETAQILTDWSLEQLASRVPSGEDLTIRTWKRTKRLNFLANLLSKLINKTILTE